MCEPMNTMIMMCCIRIGAWTRAAQRPGALSAVVRTEHAGLRCSSPYSTPPPSQRQPGNSSCSCTSHGARPQAVPYPRTALWQRAPLRRRQRAVWRGRPAAATPVGGSPPVRCTPWPHMPSDVAVTRKCAPLVSVPEPLDMIPMGPGLTCILSQIVNSPAEMSAF
jgi:hypothetical protein